MRGIITNELNGKIIKELNFEFSKDTGLITDFGNLTKEDIKDFVKHKLLAECQVGNAKTYYLNPFKYGEVIPNATLGHIFGVIKHCYSFDCAYYSDKETYNKCYECIRVNPIDEEMEHKVFCLQEEDKCRDNYSKK